MNRLLRTAVFSAAFIFPAAAAAAPAAGPGLEELLTYDLAELMNLEVVSASKHPEPASKAAATVRVITAEEIRERGYLTLEEALSGLPGFQFRDISGFNSYVFLRGLPSQNNLILLLVDGVQINELNSGGFYGGAQHNLANVKRIEVVYGPASALYGTNAVSGVVNMITRDPEDAGGSASFMRGTENSGAAGLSFARRYEGGTGLSFSAVMKRGDKYGMGGARGDGNWSAGMENFEEDWAFDGKLSRGRLELGVAVQDKRASRTTNAVSEGTDLLDFGTAWHIRFANAWLKVLHSADADRRAESRLYYRSSTVMDDTVSEVYDLTASSGQVGQYRPGELLGLETRADLRLSGTFELTAGLVLEHERLARSFSTTYSGSPLVRPAAPATPDMTRNDLLTVYAQGNYALTRDLSLVAGLRRDDSGCYGEVYTPRGGLVYSRDALSLKALYGEAFRAPKPWDYSYGAGNNSLKPEKLRSMELAGAYAFSHGLLASLSVYRNELEGLLVLDGAADRWTNAGEISVRGAEARLEFSRGRFKGHVNHSFQDSEDEDGARVAEIGLHNSGAGLTWDPAGPAKLDLSARRYGSRKNPSVIAATGTDKVDSALVADATLSVLLSGGLELRFMAKNVFNETWYHTSNRPPDRYVQPGRRFFAEARLSF
ncbi:MAG: TonB-dependent receptor [Elusimicrobiales bacterium]|nr:TonB-dependent receptor [Elusimicrobiales bacterium]